MDWENILKKEINWLDAFHKFGFDDGHEYNGQTEEIADFLGTKGYLSYVTKSGGHNTFIRAIHKRTLSEGYDKEKVYPLDSKESRSGAREDFAPELLKLLDDRYGKSTESEGITS